MRMIDLTSQPPLLLLLRYFAKVDPLWQFQKKTWACYSSCCTLVAKELADNDTDDDDNEDSDGNFHARINIKCYF